MKRNLDERWRTPAALATAALLALSLAAPATGATNARVTAAVGEVGGLSQHGGVGDDQTIETGDDGGCSLLIDDHAIVEVCGDTRLRLARNPSDGSRIIRIDQGEARIVVDPSAIGERIEIHTPAAIATILGTVVFVSVDPVTKEVTFTSQDHQMRVESTDPTVGGGVTVSGGEQVSVVPGQAPSSPRRLLPQTMAALGGCLVDLGPLSLALDRGAQESRTVKEIAEGGAVSSLPGVGAGIQVALGNVGDGVTDGTDALDPVVPTTVNDMMMDLDLPSPCSGIPSDNCKI
jgi:ferric-dicitrate binding protein FerR (iron transport regulator)